MKKVIIVLVALILVGCTPVEEKGDFEPGMYFGYYVQEEGRYKGVSTAVVFVDDNGFIAHVFLDATYIKDEIPHSKKALGDDYNMRWRSAEIGVIPGGGEWDEQAIALEEKIVAEQGLDWVSYDDEGEVDVDDVTGATMIITELVLAVEDALKEAQ